MVKQIAAVGLLVVGMAVPASATTITYLVTAIVSGSTFQPLYLPGSTLTALLTFDPNVADAAPQDLNTAQYPGALLSYSFAINGSTLITESNPIEVDVSASPHNVFAEGTFLTPFSILGQQLSTFQFSLLGGPGQPSDAFFIPTDVSAYPLAYLNLNDGLAFVQLGGYITSIQLVPEPSLAALLASGALGAFIALRRRAS